MLLLPVSESRSVAAFALKCDHHEAGSGIISGSFTSVASTDEQHRTEMSVSQSVGSCEQFGALSRNSLTCNLTTETSHREHISFSALSFMTHSEVRLFG